jgi:hypothetical protein
MVGRVYSSDQPNLTTDATEILSTGGYGFEAILNVNAAGVIDTSGGGIVGLTITKTGTGYTDTESITFLHPTGTGAVATVTAVDAGGGITEVTFTNGGTAYHNNGALTSSSVIMATLVYMDWLDVVTDTATPIRFCDGGVNIKHYTDPSVPGTVGDYDTFDEFMAIGNLGSIDTLEEGTELQSYGITLNLSGIPKDNIQEVFSDTSFQTAYQNRDCKIWTVFLNRNYEIINDPILLFAGQMDACKISVGTEIQIALTVNSRLINWEVPRGGRYNSNDQKVWFPNDTGFDLIPSLLNKEIKWGGSGTSWYDSLRGNSVTTGGGACVSVEAYMPEIGKAKNVKLNDPVIVLNETDDGVQKDTINHISFVKQPGIRVITSSGISLTCSTSTPLVIRNSNKKERKVTKGLGMEVPVLDNGKFSWETVVELQYLDEIEVAFITCNDGVYAAGDVDGKYILTHNKPEEGGN